LRTRLAIGVRKQIPVALIAAGAILVGKSAHAADFPIYAPPPVIAPVFTWSGIYVGVNAGYGFAHTSGAATIDDFLGTFVGTGSDDNVNGAIVGGQIGANFQTGMWVLGLEVDAQWSGRKHTTTSGCGFGCTLNETVEINAFGTARWRFGVALDRFLLYSTTGLAWTTAKDSVNAAGFGTTLDLVSIQTTKTGWTVGAGVEAAIAGGLSAKIEYLYIGTSGISGSAPLPFVIGCGTATVSADIHDNIVRAGLNYRF
jgi:outer membrane immunogenic protein